MMTTMNATPYTQTQSPTSRVLGETVWFTLKTNTRTAHTDVRSALSAAGLDPKMARDLAPRYAFTRAARAIARGKLVDETEDSQDRLTFQISSRVLVPAGVDYQRDATVTLDRITGTISCPDSVVEGAARNAFTVALAERRTSDVTRLISRILGQYRNQGCYPMKGGVWFVEDNLRSTVNSLAMFVHAIGGTCTRWSISDGVVQNTVQVQTVVVDSLMETIAEMEAGIEALTPQATDRVIRNAHAKLQAVEAALEANSRRIGDQMGRLEDYMAQCQYLLIRQTFQITPVPASEPTREVITQDPLDPAYADEPLPSGAIRLPEQTDSDSWDVKVGVNSRPCPQILPIGI